MIPISLADAAVAIGATCTQSLERLVTAVCTDTRDNAAGSLFFALRGENSDGHGYVRQAFQQGAIAAVVDRQIADAAGVQLVVPDTLTALGDLAGYYRNEFDIPVIGVTGSVGKTSTKEMISAVLAPRF